MKKLLLLSVLFVSIVLRAQISLQWAGSAGSTVSENGQAIATDPSGNVYVAGTFSGVIDVDPGPATISITAVSGSADIFLAKYTAAGAFVWAKQIASSSTEKAYDLAVDANGVYLAGNFMGTCNFNIGGLTSTLTSLGGGTDGDGFFAKYDLSSGNLAWVNRIGSTVNDRAIGIALDASSNIYVGGFIGGNADFDPGPGVTTLSVSGTYNAYFAKYTNAGALTFAKQITGAYSEGDDLSVDASGNIYLTGSFAQTNDFDPSPATVNLTTSGLTQLDIFMAKYDATGSYVFVKQIGGVGVDIGFQVIPDASGNIYLGGVFSATCDFNPAPGFTNNIVSNGNGDLFVAKYDASGNYLWANGTGGSGNDYCYGVGLNAAGSNVYITGNFNGGSVDFDPGPGISALSAPSFTAFYVASYSSSGAFNFVNGFGNISSGGQGICVNSALYLTGYFSSTVDFDFGVPTSTITSAGGTDAFFAKYNLCAGPPAQPSAISGTTTGCSGASYTYSVTNDPLATSYTWNLPPGWTGTSTTNIITVTTVTLGTILVTANNTCAASPSQSVFINIIPAPSLTATSSGTICSGQQATLSVSGANTYSWTGIGSGSTQVVSPTVTTAYTVSGTGVNSCTSTTQVAQSVAMCTGLAEHNSTLLGTIVYPNPFTSEINVNTQGINARLFVVNALGKTVFETSVNGAATASLSALPAGIYFVKIISGNEAKTVKLIKQ